jgi:hypothetical protein
MSTLISILVVAVVLVAAAAVTRGIMRTRTLSLIEDAKNHDFLSNDGRIKGHLTNCIFDYIIVDGIPYDSIEEVFATTVLTKDMHKTLRQMQKECNKLKAIHDKNIIIPNAFREFKDTPFGTMRIYNEGAVALSPRVTIVISKDDEGSLVVSRAIMSKFKLLADNYWSDFKLLAKFNDITEALATANNTAFINQFLSSDEYTEEVKAYEDLLRHLKVYNVRKDSMRIVRGKLAFDGDSLPYLPQNTTVANITLPAASKKNKEDEKLIRNARQNK